MTHSLVIIAEPIASEPRRWLGERCNVVEIGAGDAGFGEQLGKAAGLVVRTYTRVDAAMLDRAPNLKVVGRAGVGLDNIDLEACAARGVRVVHTPHGNAMAVVEYTISMLMRALRPIETLTGPVDSAQWHAAREAAVSEGSVVGSTLGIVGFGHIGSRVGRAAAGLGMEVRYHDLLDIRSEESHGVAGSLDEVLGSRVVCVHVDGRAGNRGLIGESALGKMRDDVVFVNASRGFVVDPIAAVAFARAHPNARLILDVHDPEPIPEGSELYGVPNIYLTPHVAAATREAKLAMSWVVRDVWAVLSGEQPRYSV